MGKPFHLGDVLSVTTASILPPRGLAGLRSILVHLLGESPFSHQLARACETAGPVLLERHPELRSLHSQCMAEIRKPGWPARCEEWMIGAAASFCAGLRLAPYLEIEPLPAGLWLQIDPVKELQALMGDDRVIAVVLPEESSDAG